MTGEGRLLAGYRPDQMCLSGRGQALMPWPNRIRDGRYTFAGTGYQLPVTEVERGNASHGLVRWAEWDLIDHTSDTVTVTTVVHPQPGWAWRLELATTYRLTHGGLSVLTQVRNISPGPAPFGYGAHPYLALAGVAAPDAVLTVPAARYLEVDPERGLPVATHPVGGTEADLRQPHALGDTELDTAFTGLERDADGLWRVRLDRGAAGTVTLWADEAFGWLQVFTAKARVGAADERGIAVEPMTCPPYAFNSGDSLVVLEPGGSWSGRWGIVPPDSA